LANPVYLRETHTERERERGRQRESEREDRNSIRLKQKKEMSKKVVEARVQKKVERSQSSIAGRCGTENNKQNSCSPSPRHCLNPSIALFSPPEDKQPETEPTAKVQRSPLSCV